MLERRRFMTRPFATKVQRDAELLRNAISRVRRERTGKQHPKLAQKDLARKHHVSPGLISQYIRGHEPLNLKWQMRFADWLALSPVEIWPDFEHKRLVSGQLPPDVVELAQELLEYNEDERAALKTLVRVTKKRPKEA